MPSPRCAANDRAENALQHGDATSAIAGGKKPPHADIVNRRLPAGVRIDGKFSRAAA
jgi:hypothetical protein